MGRAPLPTLSCVLLLLVISGDAWAVAICKMAPHGNATIAIKEEMQRLLTAELGKADPTDPIFKAIGPPTSAGGDRLVDGAGFTDFLAIAVENELLKNSEGQTTIQFTPFAWKAAFKPEIAKDTALYSEHANWRKFALSLASGGLGEKFDRNGDGTVDDALKSDGFNDIQTWELKYRLFGSRDWKDAENRKKIVALAAQSGEKLDAAWQKLFGQLRGQNFERDANGNFCGEDLALFLSNPEVRATLLEIALSEKSNNEKITNGFTEIARRWTGSLVASTTQRDPQFGQDKWAAGLRVSWGTDKKGVNFNADYTQTNGRASLPDPNAWKLGAEYVSYVLKGKFGKEGVKTSIGAVWEMFDDIPDAKHRDIGKVGLRLEFPIAGSEIVKLPISIIWANHEDVLTDADSVRAHIGFTVDFGDALKKQKKDGK
jgi:hypothetical protein